MAVAVRSLPSSPLIALHSDLFFFSIAIFRGCPVYCCPSGRRYEGEWKDGLKHGKGVKIWANGDRYEGTLSPSRPVPEYYSTAV